MRKILSVLCVVWILGSMTSCAGNVLKAAGSGNTTEIEKAIASGSDINLNPASFNRK